MYGFIELFTEQPGEGNDPCTKDTKEEGERKTPSATLLRVRSMLELQRENRPAPGTNVPLRLQGVYAREHQLPLARGSLDEYVGEHQLRHASGTSVLDSQQGANARDDQLPPVPGTILPVPTDCVNRAGQTVAKNKRALPQHQTEGKRRCQTANASQSSTNLDTRNAVDSERLKQYIERGVIPRSAAFREGELQQATQGQAKQPSFRVGGGYLPVRGTKRELAEAHSHSSLDSHDSSAKRLRTQRLDGNFLLPGRWWWGHA